VPKGSARASLNEDEIVAVALELVAEDGVASLSMRKLSARLGASLGATYRHFANKDELLRRCGREVMGRSLQPRATSDDPLEWVRDQVLNLHEALRSYRGMAAYLLAEPAAISPELVEAVEEALIAAGEPADSIDLMRLVLVFYSAGVLLSDATDVLQRLGEPDPQQVVAAGLDYILRGGAVETAAVRKPRLRLANRRPSSTAS
jgi:AcrR family transcriptional regulator